MVETKNFQYCPKCNIELKGFYYESQTCTCGWNYKKPNNYETELKIDKDFHLPQLETIIESDDVFRPQHYMGYVIEPWTFSFLNDLPGFEHAVLTYLLRWRKKNGIEDLKKCIRVIQMKIELEENKSEYIPKKGCL